MGEHVNAKWNTFLGYLVAIVLTILKFQFDRDNFYQIKKPTLQRCWFWFITLPFSILLLHFLKNSLTIFRRELF